MKHKGTWRQPGVMAALIAAMLFGAGTPLAKWLLSEISPWLLAALLYLGSGLGLSLYRIVRRSPRAKLAAGEWPWLLGAILAGGVIGPVLLMFGLTKMPASGVSLLLNAEGVFTSLLAWFVFRENFDRRIAFGMIVIVAGAVVQSWPGEVDFSGFWPALAVLGACLAWSIDNNLTRKVSLADASWIASIKGLVAGSINLVLAFLLGTTALPPLPELAAAMLVGWLAYGVSLSLFVVGLRHLGTARTGAYFSVAPFFGALFSIQFLGEPLTDRLLIAGELMALGVWIHLTERHSHYHIHERLVHDHEHLHDKHHPHEHDEPIDPNTTHSHQHEHIPLEHAHQHFPDAHHRLTHSSITVPDGQGQKAVAITKQTSASSLRVLMTRARWIEVGRILLTGLIALLFWRQWVPLPILWLAVAIGLYPLVKTGVTDLIRERKVGTEIFVTVATLVAVFGGETVAGAVLMVIILIAEFIADLNMDRARASIKTLIGSVPQVALMRGADGERVVPIEQLRAGDVVLVRAGEKIPVDGGIVGGAASIDEAPITGESLPKDKSIGASVFAGTIVASGALDIQTEKVGSNTTFARIIGLVENAEAQRAPVQKLADQVASWLIPVVFVFLIVVYMVTGDVRTIVTLLIFTSPAELGLATPLVMIAAIARAARGGILVKGGLYLESLAKADVMVFDKTGTLTANKSEVIRMEARDARFSEMELLSLAAAADRRSAHPLAKAVVDYATLKQIAVPEPDQYEQVQGRGVVATVSGHAVLVGNAALLRENGVTLATAIEDGGQTPVHVAVDGHFAGVIFIADVLRPGAREALEKLKGSGVKRIVMLTGDNEATARAVASELGVDEVRADLLPEDKVTAIEALKKQGYHVAMIGDGINDAPALARADVGIAMGGGGTQAALEAADIVLMTDDLAKIVSARAIARRAYRTIQENLFVGVGVVHVLGITAALMGWIGPIEAALLHLGPDVLVFVNSAKLLHVRIDGV